MAKSGKDRIVDKPQAAHVVPQNETTPRSSLSVNDLGFEILDLIFSYFSGPNTDLSYYENQQNLLSFCQVSKAFYQVAR